MIVTLSNPTANNEAYTYGSRSNSNKRFTTNDDSGLAGVVLDVTGGVDHYTNGTYSGTLALEASTANTNETFSITAPAGYMISGYSFSTRTTGSYTYTITANGTEYAVSNSKTTAVEVSGLMERKTTFVVNGSAANWMAVGPFTVTLTPLPITLDANKLYRIQQQWQANTYYLYSNISSNNRLWKDRSNPSSTTLITNGNYIWQAKSDDSKWKIYNPTSARYMAKATSTSVDGSNAGVFILNATSSDNAESFSLEATETCGYPPSDYNTTNYYALKSNTLATYLNSYSTTNNYVGWHNAAHAGYYFKFVPVKMVTFVDGNSDPANVTVDGSVSADTIYVATDGSDSFTLPIEYKYTFGGKTYFAKEAAATIAAAGTSNIEVTISSALVTSTSQLSNSKCYAVRTSDRGSWYVPADGTALTSTTKAEVTVDVTSPAQQFAFVYYDDTDDDTDNGSYYLYSVSEKKFIKKNGGLTSLQNTAGNAVTLLASEGNANYPTVVALIGDGDNKHHIGISNGYDPAVITSYNNLTDGGNRVQVIEVGSFDAAEALDRFNTSSVVFILKYDKKEVDRSSAQTVNRGYAQIPSGLDPMDGFMTYTYDPEIITSETEEVTVTATWNGPFQISSAPSDGNFASGTKWYTIGHNYSEIANNYIWKYNGTDNVVPETVATDNFAGVTNNHLFCFVGDPYTGFTIYNKAAGTSKNVYSSGQGNQVTMNATAQLFIPSGTDEHAVSDGYFSLKPNGSSYYLNWNKSRLAGWTSADNGGTCWVIPEGKYYLTYLNSIHLEAPAGAVGTKSGVADQSVRGPLVTVMEGLDGNLFYLDESMTAVDKAVFKTLMTGIKNSETITLTDGYYRIQSAYTGYTTPRDMYYSHSNGTIRWSKDVENDVNSVFYLTIGDGTFTMKSPNANKYVSATTGTLSESSANVTYSQLSGTLQYNLKVGNTDPMHTNGHSDGAGTEGNLVAWGGTANTASAWYIIKASKLPVGLHTIDEVAYATLCLPFDVTIDRANAYTLDQSGEWLVPTQLTDNQVPAGTPVLLRSDNPATLGETAYATFNMGAAFSTDNVNDLLGVYVPTDFELTETAPNESDVEVSCTSEYFLGVYNGTVGFYRSGVSSKTTTVEEVKHYYYTLGANKAYLGNANASRGFAIKWNDDEVTGIRTIDNGKQSVKNGAFYDLSGRRVENPQHGLYIVNGKKVVIK